MLLTSKNSMCNCNVVYVIYVCGYSNDDFFWFFFSFSSSSPTENESRATDPKTIGLAYWLPKHATNISCSTTVAGDSGAAYMCGEAVALGGAAT